MSTVPQAQAPAPFVAGETWFEQLSSYVISRYVDAEVAEAYKVNTNTPYFIGKDGVLWQSGQPVGVAQGVGVSASTLLLYAALAAGALFLILRR